MFPVCSGPHAAWTGGEGRRRFGQMGQPQADGSEGERSRLPNTPIRAPERETRRRCLAELDRSHSNAVVM